MTEYYQNQREIRMLTDWKICSRCGNRANQTAHRIARTKDNITEYGIDVIDHNINLVCVCSLECNDSYNIGNNPKITEKLVSIIRDNINKPETVDNFLEYAEIEKLLRSGK